MSVFGGMRFRSLPALMCQSRVISLQSIIRCELTPALSRSAMRRLFIDTRCDTPNVAETKLAVDESHPRIMGTYRASFLQRCGYFHNAERALVHSDEARFDLLLSYLAPEHSHGSQFTIGALLNPTPRYSSSSSSRMGRSGRLPNRELALTTTPSSSAPTSSMFWEAFSIMSKYPSSNRSSGSMVGS